MTIEFWYLIGAALVFFMQAGFAMVETGFTRAKNAGNIIMKNLMDFCIGTVVFMLLGFGLMMGEDALFGLIGVPNIDLFTKFSAFIESPTAGFTDASIFVFNLVFCATAATIVSGSMAERTHLFGHNFAYYLSYRSALDLGRRLARATRISRLRGFYRNTYGRRNNRAHRCDYGRPQNRQIRT